MKKVSLLVSMLLLSQSATKADFGESFGGSFAGSTLSNAIFSGNRGGDVDYVGREEARNMRAERQAEERERREDKKEIRKLKKEIKNLERKLDREDDAQKITYYTKKLNKAQKRLEMLEEDSY